MEKVADGRMREEAGRQREAERAARVVKQTLASEEQKDGGEAAEQDALREESALNAAWAAQEESWLSGGAEAPDGEALARMNREAGQRGQELSALAVSRMEAEPNVRLELTVMLSRREDGFVRAGLRVGNKKLYVVKDIPQFLGAVARGEACAFGKGFEYQPDWMRFSRMDLRLLGFFRRLVSAYEAARWVPSGAEARLLRLPQEDAGELLDLMRNEPMRVMLPDGETIACRRIPESALPLHFDVRLTPRGLSLSAVMPTDWQAVTADCAYIVWNRHLLHVPDAQRELVRYLGEKQINGRALFDYPLQETGQVVGEILPYLKLRASLEMGAELRAMLVQLPLKTRVYLDKDGSAVVAQVLFRYGETELNPFGAVRERITLEKGEKLLLRDAEAEHRVLDILANAGFRVTKDNIRLLGQDAIYDFVSEGVQKLSEVSEVFLSRDFRKITPRRPALGGSMRMDGDRLLVSLTVDGEPTDEILTLMEALSRRRKYYRLRDGTFLDLRELEGWQEPAESLCEAALRDGGEINRSSLVLRGFRSSYLLSMMEGLGIPVEADARVRENRSLLMGESRAAVPESGLPLRDYQRRGYEWLYTLHTLHMGGVLADDMGLGKTIQVIALLKAVQARDRTSLIVAPTSLTYNWLSEINRFAPELSAVVAGGTAVQRGHLLRHITENSDVDVVITSYPLIRRDIDLVDHYRFSVAVLDEAQNIKNAGSIAAAAVKRLRADARLALTGTPMENGVGELWSIFDFVLPGYLPGYNAFLRRYQDGTESEDLRRRIRPFLTRRLKQEVLSELPDKNETRLTADMTAEQRNVYQAAMERLRPRMNQLLEEKGLRRGRMEVLSALTELREICCHPSLVLDGYVGSSGKMEMLMEILPGLIHSGRRVLIFSQFTSMLKILRPRLEAQGWELMYLDGATPAGERVEMTEKFNTGNIPIFLISLRAGGSGLNLTGADVVIHYDPWWNPAAEDQATDRAHRIGQTRKVDVFRLVTGGSIEEQVVELGSRKKALFDRLITPGESELSALSEQDIRSLFG